MILLISSKYDITSQSVSRWLSKLKADYFILNTEDFNSLNSFSLSDNDINIKINGIDFSDVDTVWHRRGRLRHIPKELNGLGSYSEYLKKEEDALIKSIELYLKSSTNYIGSYIKEVENYKLYNLSKAKEVGLKIPKTLVTTSKSELSDFIHNKTSISKDIRYSVNIKTQSKYISSIGTFIVQTEDLELLEENFAPTLVQELIQKEFEIRVFFFDNTFYVMAIFSQDDEKTKLDYRNYNEEKQNRCVPFILPNRIKNKLTAFAKKVNIRTGSIDIIYTTLGEYIFLEINPMGQLDWVSKNCNYHIEKDIANNLFKSRNERN